MIKILNKKIEEPKTYKAFCGHCDAELEYEKCDTYIGVYGGRELICPSCGQKTSVDQPAGIDLNFNNIKYPSHFYYMGDGVDISNQKIQQYIEDLLNKAEQDEDDYTFYYAGTGNTMVFVVKGEEEYSIFVTKDYSECCIPR